MILTGWGRASRARAQAYRPERMGQLAACLRDVGERGVLAYGGGRSYGDAALNDGGRVILTERLDRLLAFDEATSELICEAGVTFETLLDVFLPRGFMPPVSPGTAYATVGGAIATDVHGKNHEAAGSFGNHVLWLDLLLPSGELVRASPDERPELFAATIGGIGLTGLIVRLAVRLARAPSAAVHVTRRRMSSLDAFIDAFDARRRETTFSVGWIDGLARGGALGRGILETAEFAGPNTSVPRPPRRRRVRLDFPSFVLKPLSVRLFNELYFRRVPATASTYTEHIRKFLYPLDSVLEWNRIYGRRGFYQFQCVIPDAESRHGLRSLLEPISQARSGSFLSVLKTLGAGGRGYLSFPMPGYTLALDFPRIPANEELLRGLAAIAGEHGGRVYLAKDSLLAPDTFARMYPKLPEFRRVLADLGGGPRFQSDMARRLKILPAV